jgi:F420-dependent oxidoreductase-like protein
VLRLADPSLVVLVGPSASGKSTWAAEHFAADQIVSSDRLRAMVGEGERDVAASADALALVDTIVEARLRRRLTTVVDTLGFDDARRASWLALARRHDVPTVAVAFDTPAGECRRRNSARNDRVPVAILDAQLRTFTALRPRLDHDGFDTIITPEPVRVVAPGIASAARAMAMASGAVPETPRGSLRFGLHLSAFDVPGGAKHVRHELRRVAGAAEDAGFDSLWVMDHFVQIPQVGRPWDDMLESTTALAYLAAVTERASVGCLVHAVTHRNVAVLGKALATIDVLSGGRLWCGLGLGWFEAEHRGYAIPFPSVADRYARLEDALKGLRLMWGKGSPGYAGTTLEIPDTTCYPRPLRGTVPILVGGSGERRTLRLAAEYADACNVMGDVNLVRHKVEVLHRHCRNVDRDPSAVEVTHLSTALVATTPPELEREVERHRPRTRVQSWLAATNPGTIDDHVLRARALQQCGVEHVIVRLLGVWDSPAIECFGKVIAAFR